MISDTDNRCDGNFRSRWITDMVIEGLRKEMGLDFFFFLKATLTDLKNVPHVYQLTLLN